MKVCCPVTELIRLSTCQRGKCCPTSKRLMMPKIVWSVYAFVRIEEEEFSLKSLKPWKKIVVPTHRILLRSSGRLDIVRPIRLKEWRIGLDPERRTVVWCRIDSPRSDRGHYVMLNKNVISLRIEILELKWD